MENQQIQDILNKQKAYFMIPFEQEAYEYDNQLDYLETRKPHSWTKYKV